ncbi:MAG: hypothetical protein KDC54_14750 [Lewinella sp.]|nr:hypothetical protein [Lewinella sp.]
MHARYLIWLCLLLPLRGQAQQRELDWGLHIGAEWMALRGLSAFPPGRTGQLMRFRAVSFVLPSMGIHARLPLGERLSVRSGLRFLPQDYALYFTWTDQLPHREDIRGWELGVPLLLELHNPDMPARPYAFAGPVYTLHYRQPPTGVHQLEFKPHEIGINFGVGLTLGQERPVFRPEFNFHLGVTNILRGAREVRYLEEIGRDLQRDYVALRLLIEP